jgi:hypothetical protein
MPRSAAFMMKPDFRRLIRHRWKGTEKTEGSERGMGAWGKGESENLGRWLDSKQFLQVAKNRMLQSGPNLLCYL